MLRHAALHCLVLGALILSGCAAPAAENEPPFPAGVEADCAPWDGPAFTASVPFDTGRLITISIYRSPDIEGRHTFAFPDSSGRVGIAMFWPEFGAAEELAGSVSFDNVQRGTPIHGTFDLRSASGVRYHGRFLAIWGQRQAYCG
jgi:hypothetical protein